MEQRERDIEQNLVRMVKNRGGLCMKWVCPGWAGVPDRIVLLPGGHIIFVELKRPTGGRVAARQKYWKKKLTELGFIVLLVKNQGEIHDLSVLIDAIERGDDATL